MAASLLCFVCRPHKSVKRNNSYANSTMRQVLRPGLYDPNAPTEAEMFIEQFVPLGLLGGNGWADEAMMLRVGTGRELELGWMNRNFDDRVACVEAMRAAHGMPPMRMLLMGPCMEFAHRLRIERLGGIQVDGFPEVAVHPDGGVSVLGDVHPTAALFEKKSKNVQAGHETQAKAQQVTLCSPTPPAPPARSCCRQRASPLASFRIAQPSAIATLTCLPCGRSAFGRSVVLRVGMVRIH